MASTSILDTESDFINLFKYWLGPSECPEEYYEWVAISMIAACLAKRAYTTKWIGSQLKKVWPNLYVLMIGPSGNYKSYALGSAMDLLEETVADQHIRVYRGRITAPALFDLMVPKKDHMQNDKMYIVNDELALTIGSDKMADLMVKTLTELYMLPPFEDQSRSGGKVKLKNYSLNWIANTPEDWLSVAISRDAIMGGFFGRIVAAVSGYSDARIFKIPPPADQEIVRRYLIERLNGMFYLAGEWEKTPQAEKIEEAWYMAQPAPDPLDTHTPTMRRAHDIMLKLSLIYSVSRGNQAYIIDDDDMTRARLMMEYSVKNVARVSRAIQGRDPELQASRALLAMVRQYKTMALDKLQEMAYDNYGWKSDTLKRHVSTWVESAKVTMKPNGKKVMITFGA